MSRRARADRRPPPRDLPTWAAERQTAYAALRRGWTDRIGIVPVEIPLAAPGPLTVDKLVAE